MKIYDVSVHIFATFHIIHMEKLTWFMQDDWRSLTNQILSDNALASKVLRVQHKFKTFVFYSEYTIKCISKKMWHS